MGSLARDKSGDILVGYSESCGSTCPGGTPMFPSIFVAGRVPGDAAGTLEPEVQLVAGTGSQPDTSNRWGDYSSMRIDQDGCTFWYTTEYYKVTSTFDWSTQVGSFSFANCGGGGGGAAISFTPASLKFGKVPVGTTKGKKKVTVTNTGNADAQYLVDHNVGRLWPRAGKADQEDHALCERHEPCPGRNLRDQGQLLTHTGWLTDRLGELYR